MKTAVSPEKLKAGNEQAFADFYKAYFPLFLSFTSKFIHEPETARDIVQDVFIDYLKRRHAFTQLIQIKVFFYRSIRNKCLNLIAKEKTRQKWLCRQNQTLQSNEHFLNTILREETAFLLYQEMEKLSPTGRQILEMTLDGKSNEEIARQLAVSVNTVKTHKARSYAQLRKQLRNLHLLLTFFIIF